MPFKATKKEYEVREDETVGELREKVEKQLDISWTWGAALIQDSRELLYAVILGEAHVDFHRPLMYARR